jgi:mono/diheme cytochrome c family protein
VGTLSQPTKADKFGNLAPSTKEVTVAAGVAWRAVPTASGGAMVVHQQAVVDDIPISEPTQQGSAYGGGADGMGCSGIVKNVVSRVEPDGSVTSSPFNSPPLPVDVALSPDGQWIAVAHAGVADPASPRPFVELTGPEGAAGGPVPTSAGFPGASSVTILSTQSLASGVDGCAFAETLAPIADPATAVAFAPNGGFLAQTREPPQLVYLPGGPGDVPVTIALPGAATLDTGHELFHRDAGGGIACASCHPEGGEDGHTWHFVGTGARRTQALHVGLRGTAPFHWNGDLANVGELMSEVFVGRMGGVRQTEKRLDTLSEWLFSIKRPPAIRDSADDAAVRGKALFESASVACTSCHSGEKLTNNQNASVSLQGSKLQVPSLVAIGYRSPFMHDGCAATLAARFDPACGGNAHGNTADLSPAQISDLIAYLETL